MQRQKEKDTENAEEKQFEDRREENEDTEENIEERQKLLERAKNAVREIPIDILAHEWLRESPTSTETRLYMVDKLLPTLILGVCCSLDF